jgi:uncharacterized protein (DUF2141 family)
MHLVCISIVGYMFKKENFGSLFLFHGIGKGSMDFVRYFYMVCVGVFLSPHLYGQSAATFTLTIVGVNNNQGSVRAALFNSEKNFLEAPTYGQIVTANKDSVVIIFKDVVNGAYAISIMHDENNNGKLDTNIVGIPKEGFGFGNDSLGTFGPPSFEKAKVVILSPQSTHTMKMRYF